MEKKVVTVLSERMNIRKAFVTPWDNVAYPPSKFKNGNLTKCQMHGASEVARRAFAFI